MLWKRLRVLGSVAHYHPKCQSGTSAPHLDSVCAPVGKICIIRIVFQSLKVIVKGLYMGEHLSSNWNRQSIYRSYSVIRRTVFFKKFLISTKNYRQSLGASYRRIFSRNNFFLSQLLVRFQANKRIHSVGH